MTLRKAAPLLLAILALAAAGPSAGEVAPTPSATDPRIRVVQYDPDQIVLISATFGYALTLAFAPGERIETVSVGDSLGWQVTPNRRANLLFLKPLDRAPPTNMTVVSNLRTYEFELRARGKSRGPDPDLVYEVRFDYPAPAVVESEAQPPPAPPQPPQDRNHAYSYQGSRAGLPVRVFDDGTSTYFVFPERAELPAIFAIEADRKESVVNVAQRDGFVIVDRIAPAFALRRGTEVTRIVNDGYAAETVQTSEIRPHGRD